MRSRGVWRKCSQKHSDAALLREEMVSLDFLVTKTGLKWARKGLVDLSTIFYGSTPRECSFQEFTGPLPCQACLRKGAYSLASISLNTNRLQGGYFASAKCRIEGNSRWREIAMPYKGKRILSSPFAVHARILPLN